LDTVTKRSERTLEAAERDIDRFIERRHERRILDEGERRDLEAWELSARVHAAAVRRERAEAWRLYHLEQAERAERNAAEIASEHRRRAEKLLEANEQKGA
jgi:hypothetical protein